MKTQYLKGTEIAYAIRKQVRKSIEKLPVRPKLATIVASEDPAVLQYLEGQKRACEEIGILFEQINLSSTTTEENMLAKIHFCNNDQSISGILVLLPLPMGISGEKIHQAIFPEKDVEGVTPHNLGKIFYGDFSVAPCTAKAVWLLLQSLEMSLAGKEMVVISHSRIVGSPLVLMALCEQSFPLLTVTCCHKGTRDLLPHSRRADILVVATGTPGLITGSMIKPGVIILDVAINEIDENGEKRFVGDVDYNSIIGVADRITPVQEGVGIVTTSILMENLLYLHQQQNNV